MKNAKEIQEAIRAAEDLIKKTVDGLIAQGIQVHQISIDSVLESGDTIIDLRTSCITSDDQELTNSNSTLAQWIERLHVECAYLNIPIAICGGIEEWTEAYNDGCVPWEYVQDNLDAAGN